MENMEQLYWRVDKFNNSLISYGKTTRNYPNNMFLDVFGNRTYSTRGLICETAVRRVLKCFMTYYCDIRINPSDFVITHEKNVAQIKFARGYDFTLACVFFRKSPNFKVIEINGFNKSINVMHMSDYQPPSLV